MTAARDHLDVHILDAFIGGVWLTHPFVMLMTPVVMYRSWLLIRGASWAADAGAAHQAIGWWYEHPARKSMD